MKNANYFLASESVLAVERTIRLPKPSFRFDREKDTRRHVYVYDFEFQTLTASVNGASTTGEQISVIPFSAVDENVLLQMSEKLVEMGGKLPDRAVLPAKPRMLDKRPIVAAKPKG
jgi:hypothetical protein